MDPEEITNISVFSKESPFPPETYHKLEALFKSNKWKHLSIQKGGKILIKLHEDVLEEGFPETLVIFESNNQVVSLPEGLDAENLELLVKYFYLREVSPTISIGQSVNLLNLAVFFKVHSLTKEIQEFLLGNADKNENALEILKNSLESYLFFNSIVNSEFPLEGIHQILLKSMEFLLKNNQTEEILKCFNSNFFKKMENTQIIEKSFNFFLETFKQLGFSNETLLEFLILYKDKLIAYFTTEDKNFNKEEYYKRFLVQNLDLEAFDLDNIQNYLEKLDIEGNNLVFRAMSKKITICKSEMKEMTEKMSILEKKIRDFEGETKKSEEKIKLNFEGKLLILEEKLLKIKEEEAKIQKSNSFFEYSKYTFIPPNNGALSLSNSDTTVEKISRNGYYDGIQCEIGSMIRSSAKLLFSIKIEKTYIADIVYGFCIKNHDSIPDQGYHCSKYSFMLHLVTGSFFYRSSSIKDFIQKELLIGPAQVNQIFSASFDFKLKTISFYLNGILLGCPLQTYLNKEDAELMCPCVDLYHEGDKVSLVIQEVFNL